MTPTDTLDISLGALYAVAAVPELLEPPHAASPRLSAAAAASNVAVLGPRMLPPEQNDRDPDRARTHGVVVAHGVVVRAGTVARRRLRCIATQVRVRCFEAPSACWGWNSTSYPVK